MKQYELNTHAMGHTLESTKKPTVIFLADDDEDDIFLFKQAIDDTGISCQVHVSENGDELIQSLDEFSPAHPSLVFLDMNMPVKKRFGVFKANP